MVELGSIQHVPLREIWKDEAREFTPWLASPEGLALLGETLGYDLEFISTESAVGNYRADIIAKIADQEDDSPAIVIIENQLESTNHDHLGKIITYAAGHEVSALVWIASEFREEHRQALDWLNEKLYGIDCFGLQITAIRIDNSSPAPQFKLISSPNEWAKVVRSSRNKRTDEYSDRQMDQFRYWEELRDYVNLKNSNFRLTRKPYPQHWYSTSLGKTGVELNLIINLDNNICRTEIWLSGETAKVNFDKLLFSKDQIENKLGYALDWDRLDEKKSCRISYSIEYDILDETERKLSQKWFYKTGTEFLSTFRPFVQKI